MKNVTSQNLEHTLFSLQSISIRLRLLIGGVCSALVLFFVGWGILADLPLLVAAQGIVGSEKPTEKVVSMVDGTVTKNNFTVGQIVSKGAVLVELDDHLAREKLRGLSEKVSAIKGQLEDARMRKKALHTEIEMSVALKDDENKELVAQVEEKHLQARLAEERLRKLKEIEGISPFELENASAAHQTALLIHRAWQSKAHQGPTLASQLLREIEESIYEHSQQVATQESQLDEAQTALKQAEQELERRAIRAPISGHILELLAPTVGGTLLKGDVVARIEPAESNAILAIVEASKAGKVKSGQRCWFELDSYPPLRFGRVPCRVSGVLKSGSLGGTEAVDEKVRMWVIPTTSEEDRIPQKHLLARGNTGTVYIEVERASPLELVLEKS